MAIFNSYVSLPEGIMEYPQVKTAATKSKEINDGK